jgi:hypothetical protein
VIQCRRLLAKGCDPGPTRNREYQTRA